MIKNKTCTIRNYGKQLDLGKPLDLIPTIRKQFEVQENKEVSLVNKTQERTLIPLRESLTSKAPVVIRRINKPSDFGKQVDFGKKLDFGKELDFGI